MTEKVVWFVSSYVQRNLALIIVILAVLLVRLLMKKMPKKLVYCLWAIVGVRMLLLVQIPSPVSIYQLFPWADPQAQLSANASQSGPELISTVEREVSGKALASRASASDALESDVLAGDVSKNNAMKGNVLASDAHGNSGTERLPSEETLNAKRVGEEGLSQKTVLGEDADGAMAPGIGLVAADGKRAESNLAADPALAMAGGRNAADTFADEAYLAQSGVMAVAMAKLRDFLRKYAVPFFCVYSLGMLLVIGIGLISYVRVQKHVRKAVHFEGNLWECDGISTPFVLGILRPRIFVPFHLKEEHRELVLEHERQHLKHFDPFTRLLAYALLAVYWMNPLVWVSYFCFVRDQEMRCDEAVLSSLGAESKKQYGLTLLAFATEQRFVGFTPVAFGESDAKKRIKNILDYKKPGFWAIFAAVLILLCLGIVCLTTAMKNKNAKEPEGGDVREFSEGMAGTDEKQEAGKTDRVLYQSNMMVDLDGDGEKEQVEIMDFVSGKSVLKTRIQGKRLEELTLQSTPMIQTQAKAADFNGDGREELVLLQSSPMLASTYNWPGKVTILQVLDGTWREMSDRFIYPENGEPAYQEYYPRKLTDGICVGVQIESTELGTVLCLIYPQGIEASHGKESMLCVECTYQSEGEEGWLVRRVYTLYDYLQQLNMSDVQAYTITIDEGDILKWTHDFQDPSVDHKCSPALRIGSENEASIMAMGLPVTYQDAWNQPDPEYQTSYRRSYVYGNALVAESHGFGENQDYVDDLDGDGVSEIICYAKSMETGDYDEVTVFRRKDNLIYMGRLVNAGLLKLENCDTLSAYRRISEHYDPETHQLYVTYPVKGGGYANETFTYEDMLFTEYSYVEPTDWKEKYADRIRRMDADQFALIYLDDDEIPEVYCASGQNAMWILTCQDGKIKERSLHRDGLIYLEKQGIYYTEGGNMGYFPLEIVQLKDGEFSVLAQGLWTSEYVTDENNPDQMKLVDTYQWEGTNVSAEEYYKNIDEIIERKNTTKISGTVTKDEILTELGMVITSLAQG
ncbi:MAG: M56 family metallopeptidase [Acetatifactor sp.]|nr:M56 family metallopeptidase [Acetatifactor sp.]